MRVLEDSWLWILSYPVRVYIKHAPWNRGKSFLTRQILRRIVPNEGSFFVSVPGGAEVELLFSETLGLSTLVRGMFEGVELRWIYEHSGDGGIVIDVGANVGMFSCVAGMSPSSPRVWAFEPVCENVKRLRKNMEHNGIHNVEIFEYALGATREVRKFHLAKDGAYGSFVEVRDGFKSGVQRGIMVLPLDEMWRRQGSPRIDTIKIDVEGAEIDVLSGAGEVLRECLPALLIEANSLEDHHAIVDVLAPLGYKSLQPKGFKPWNYLFLVE